MKLSCVVKVFVRGKIGEPPLSFSPPWYVEGGSRKGEGEGASFIPHLSFIPLEGDLHTQI